MILKVDSSIGDRTTGSEFEMRTDGDYDYTVKGDVVDDKKECDSSNRSSYETTRSNYLGEVSVCEIPVTNTSGINTIKIYGDKLQFIQIQK